MQVLVMKILHVPAKNGLVNHYLCLTLVYLLIIKVQVIAMKILHTPAKKGLGGHSLRMLLVITPTSAVRLQVMMGAVNTQNSNFVG
jgi:hypothetical protein